MRLNRLNHVRRQFLSAIFWPRLFIYLFHFYKKWPASQKVFSAYLSRNSVPPPPKKKTVQILPLSMVCVRLFFSWKDPRNALESEDSWLDFWHGSNGISKLATLMGCIKIFFSPKRSIAFAWFTQGIWINLDQNYSTLFIHKELTKKSKNVW